MSVRVVPVGHGGIVEPVGVGTARPTLEQLTDVAGTAEAPTGVPLALRKGPDGVFRPESMADAIDEAVGPAITAVAGPLVNDAVEQALSTGAVVDAVEAAVGPAVDQAVTGRLSFREDWSAPTLLVQVQHGLPYPPAGVLVRDGDGVIVDPADITHPLPGITEITFGVPIGPATAWLS